MGIGRFDLFGTQPQPDSLDLFFHAQQERIEAIPVPVHPRPARRSRLDPGGAYTLEIRGHAPAQIALTETPHELLKRDGEAAYKGSVGAFMSGS